ncbi:SH3 domain-containing protein [Mesorhizobium sp. B292B1B]|uniref:SH3 domain-containing protein n=1 Tax=unclassified Mesorhizobium TaxID=325217 RepID=UPI00112B38F7|nr:MULTISPECIES: SH3 domain-containing protein [unclassified Mesorhizobium]MCA0014424.1 SH3 domain-containing protein [Mesorhizobium sp. B294B1A1]MCA0036415.1 SH3 domain-containing protein [Mesorhizobium sp. B292B1B]TPM42318.1 SH3 domain-containing protein [Mesorhizobium sp. B2-3-2]
MREPFSFGAPERRRFAMQFGYDMRPSFWQEVRSNSHLVIAAVGTAALLGVAAVALWLALPANERQAVANPEQAIPAVPVKTTKIAPAGITVAAAAVPQAARKSDQVSPTVAVAEAAIPALAANDPRWTASQSKTAPASEPAASGQSTSKAGQTADKPAAAAAFAQPAADTDAAAELAKVAAPAPAAGSTPDGAQTAAIPAAQPQQAAAQQDDDSKAEPRKAAAAGTGRILRAVTMRSGPKKNAAAIVTVPAKTSVQVMSCKRWCQIVYNGKTGWVYKTYIKTGA